MSAIDDKVTSLMMMSEMGPERCQRGLQVNNLALFITHAPGLDEDHQRLFWASVYNKVTVVKAIKPDDLPDFVAYDKAEPLTWPLDAKAQKEYDRIMLWAKKESLAALANGKRKRVPTEKALAAIFEKNKKKKPSPEASVVSSTSRRPPPPPPPPSSSSPLAASSSPPADIAEPLGTPSGIHSYGSSSSSVINLADSGSDTETDDGPSGRKKARQSASQASASSQASTEPKKYKDLIFISDAEFAAEDGGETMVLRRLLKSISKTTANLDMWESFFTPRILTRKEQEEWRARKGYSEPRMSCKAHAVLAGFQCRSCDTLIIRQACLMSNNAKLLNHYNSCSAKNNHTLTDVGTIKQPMTADYLQFTLVESIATNNRPFNLVNDLMIQRFLNVLPSPRPKAPSAKSLSRDVILFGAFLRTYIVQQILDDMGDSVLHIAMDGWTSPNHNSFLGVSGSWWSALDGKMRTVTLDFIYAPASHTGVEMAEQLTKSLVSLGLNKKFASITLDNAYANDTLVAALSDCDEFPRFQGSDGHVRCFAHTLNLITKAFLFPFSTDFDLSTLTKKAENLDDIDHDLADEAATLSRAESQLEKDARSVYDIYYDDSARAEAARARESAESEVDSEVEVDEAAGEERGRADRETLLGMLGQQPQGSGDELFVPEMSELIEEVAANLGQVLKGRKTIQKVRLIAKATANSSKYRSAFRQMFVSAISNDKYEEGLSRRHIPRDVATRWNSTCDMLEVALGYRAVIPFFYKQPALKNSEGLKAFPPAFRLTSADFDTISLILACLMPLRRVTIILQSSGEGSKGSASMVTLARIIPIIDRLTRTFESVVNDDVGHPLNIRVGARLALGVLNKYYRLTGDSNLYSFAILLHPSLRVQYMRDQKWEREWEETAIEALKQLFDCHYRKKPVEQSATSNSSDDDFWDFPVRSISAASRRHPVDEWVYGPVSMRDEGGQQRQVDPLAWWAVEITSSHALACNGMRQMAIDILTANATSCAPERAFSKAGLTVSKHRQSLKPNTIAALQCVGAWVKQGWAGYEVWRQWKKVSRSAQADEEAE